MQKLIDQVPVPGMHFHPVELRLPGVSGRLLEIRDHAPDLVEPQAARHDEALGLRARSQAARNGAGRHRHFARQVFRIRYPPGMPQLQDDAPTASVHGVRHRPPGLGLGGIPDARRIRMPDAQRRHRGGPGQDQARVGALRVVRAHAVVWHATLHRPPTRRRRHDDTVGQFDFTQPDRIEQTCHIMREKAGLVQRIPYRNLLQRTIQISNSYENPSGFLPDFHVPDHGGNAIRDPHEGTSWDNSPSSAWAASAAPPLWN